jgi:hypothetical protein
MFTDILEDPAAYIIKVSETSVTGYQAASWCLILERKNARGYCHENLKS